MAVKQVEQVESLNVDQINDHVKNLEINPQENAQIAEKHTRHVFAQSLK